MTTPNTLKITAYRLLAQREYSSSKLTQKLLQKRFQLSEIKQLIIELEQEGALSDARYIDCFIRQRQRQGYGPLRIRQELRAEGLAKEMIEDQLDIADNAWFDEARRIWQKRFRGQKPTELKEQGKQQRFMHYRGFTPEQIKSIFNEAD